MPDHETLRQRLAAVRDQGEVAEILGKRRFLSYGVAFAGAACAFASLGAYLAVQVAIGQRTAWILLVLPAFAAAASCCGVIGYGLGYFGVTGRRWSRADALNRVFARLNSNL